MQEHFLCRNAVIRYRRHGRTHVDIPVPAALSIGEDSDLRQNRKCNPARNSGEKHIWASERARERTHMERQVARSTERMRCHKLAIDAPTAMFASARGPTYKLAKTSSAVDDSKRAWDCITVMESLHAVGAPSGSVWQTHETSREHHVHTTRGADLFPTFKSCARHGNHSNTIKHLSVRLTREACTNSPSHSLLVSGRTYPNGFSLLQVHTLKVP